MKQGDPLTPLSFDYPS